MRKFKLLLEYDGTRYHGWQIQPNGLTIQELLQTRLQTITKRKTSVMGAGRTDAGVHAEGQVAHFTSPSRMEPMQFLKALNSLLPCDVVVKAVEEVGPEFHAMYSATQKLYRYCILNRDHPSALRYRYAHYVVAPLKVPPMRRAAAAFLGTHDFAAFRASGCGARTSVRTLYACSVKKQGDQIIIEVKGSGFLKYMVRNIVGTLIEVGKGRMTLATVKEVLASGDRRRAGPTAPARGLCLVRVMYDPVDG
ncbi:MAG: tRNA pseudouridine(38-40) synthase TruA [Nitrospinaceae bacterium]